MQFLPPTQKIAIPKYKVFFVNRETKTKLFLALTVKIDMCMSFFNENILVVAARACELS